MTVSESLDKQREQDRAPDGARGGFSGELEQRLFLTHGNVTTTLRALSKDLGVTAGHLSRVFRSGSSRAFRTAAVQIRHQHALNLLITTTMGIKEIAAKAGYKHVSDFSSSFKLTYGVPPGKIRRQSRSITSTCFGP
jgi:AraC-like DNA-binding protein